MREGRGRPSVKVEGVGGWGAEEGGGGRGVRGGGVGGWEGVEVDEVLAVVEVRFTMVRWGKFWGMVVIVMYLNNVSEAECFVCTKTVELRCATSDAVAPSASPP